MPLHVLYDPGSDHWDGFFSNQVGGSPYYEGVAYRRGAQYGGGVGTILATVMGFLVPIARSAAYKVGQEGLAMGSRVMDKMAEGDAFTPALKAEAKTALKNITKKGQQGGGKGRKRGKARKPHSLIGKRLRSDVLPLISTSKKDPFDP